MPTGSASQVPKGPAYEQYDKFMGFSSSRRWTASSTRGYAGF